MIFVKNFFGIEDSEFLNKKNAIVLNGIAGSAKSSNVDAIYKAFKEEYDRYTSTHKLKRDAIIRYGGNCQTIAGGLFRTINGIMFAEEKELDRDIVVIDEILQTDPRVFDWVEHHIGKYKIIVCTDDHQMLSPESGKKMLKRFQEFCKRDDVIVCNLEKTYRARTPETEQYYHDCYDAVSCETFLFNKDKKRFRTIPFAALEYNHNDIYICHTNEIEKYFFRHFKIGEDYDAPLIPKGAIAKKPPKDPTKYPILCQSDTGDRNMKYYQPEHIGTPTRYQGSEVADAQTLYYLVESYSKVEPREWYTVVSRCYDIRNLVIVICDIPKVFPLTKFNGKPVKKLGWYQLQDSEKLADGRSIGDLVKGAGTDGAIVPQTIMNELTDKIKDNDITHYRREGIICNGIVIKPEREEKELPKSNKSTCGSLLRKEPDFDYSDSMPDFFRSFEESQKSRCFNSKCEFDYINSPRMINNERFSSDPLKDMEGYNKRKKKSDYKYGLDLRASYPFIMNFAKLPSSSGFYPRPRELDDDPYFTTINTGKIDWYCSWGSDIIPTGTICTGEVAKFLQSKGMEMMLYIGSSDCKIGSLMGAKLYGMATDCVETNEDRKNIHYGYMEKPWMEPIRKEGTGEVEGYFINENNTHQLLMIAIKNQQLLNILKIKDLIYRGDLSRGLVIVDCLYFDYSGDIQKLGERIKKLIPEYDFRIFENSEEDKNGNILYQTYEDLKTRTELQKEKRRKKKAR